MVKKVTVIKAAKEQKHTQEERRLKVCGYARVSTGNQAQATSYTAQVEYYTEKIESNPLWEFAGVYADEGISGTNVKHRDEFQMMISDCEDGNIDLILTKSITRFARNTVECIQTIRKLKEIGVGIYFEKENINTLSEKSELFITILASVAQGESENISSNNRWAIQKRFQDGTYIISTPAYGYGKDEDGNLVIIESEAETVRWIYESYLNGMGAYEIEKALNQKGIPTIRGAEKWQDGVIQDILKNPIYEGDTLQQRTYTETRFPFVRRVNNGQRNQYLIKDSHPPIVTHEEAEAVRNLMAYRVDVLHMNKSDYTKRYLFSGECGKTFRRQKIYIGKPYEKIIWTCSGHVEDKESCCMKAIREDVLHRAFTDMWNKLYTNQGTILEPLLKELTELVAARQDSEEIRQLDKEIKNISEQSQILNQVMRKGYMDSALFMESSSKLGWQLTECRRKKTLLTRKLRRTKKIVRTEQLIQLIAEQDGLREEFDEQLFRMTAEKIEAINGILNGTTNYILSKMEKEGADFAAVLKEAQDKGYAERNPEADVEGYDACRKIAILSSLMFSKNVDSEKVPTEGITKITAADFEYANATDHTIKLLGRSRAIDDNTAEVMVAPFLLSKEHPLAMVHGVFNAVFVTGNMLGDSMYYGRGAGKLPTASAVVSDVVDCARHQGKVIMCFWDKEEVKLADIGEAGRSFFIRAKAGAEDAVTAAFPGDRMVHLKDRKEDFGYFTQSMKEKDFQAKYEALGEQMLGRIRLV